MSGGLNMVSKIVYDRDVLSMHCSGPWGKEMD